MTNHDIPFYDYDDDSLALEERAPVGILLSDVQPERLSWLWHARIPLGKVTLLDGDPGLGKSTMALDLAARVTTGRAMPGDAPGKPAGVVVLTAEDGLADTVRPRLDAAGADCERVVALDVVRTAEDPDGRLPVIPDDLPELERAMERVSAQLVIVDPLMAYLGSDTNSYRDQDVRRALHPLVRLADETGVAVLVIRHLNKSVGGNPLYRGGGSIAFIGAVRSGLLVAQDPDDETRRVLASTKCNLAQQPESLAFHLAEAGSSAKVVWDGASPHGAGQLLSEPTDAGDHSSLSEAKDVLADILDCGPVPALEAKRRAKDAGVADRTLDRAKSGLGVRSKKSGTTGGWVWELPNDSPRTPRTPTLDDGVLRESWRPSATLDTVCNELGAREIAPRPLETLKEL